MEQPGSHYKVFMKLESLNIFLKSVEKVKVSLKYENNNGHFT